MPSYVTPKKNAQFIFYISLVSQVNTKIMHVNPTLAAADFKVATDDGVPGALGTTPVIDADFTKRVKVTLATGEMNGDNVTFIASDAAGDEWCDLTVNIQTTANQVDDIPTTTEFELRTLLAAAYTVVGDLGTVQSADNNTILAHTDYGNAKLARTGADGDTLETLSDQIDAVPTGQEIWDLDSSLAGSPDFGTLLERAYQYLQNKINITDANGSADLRAIGDGSSLATWSITDDDTTTTRTEATWA